MASMETVFKSNANITYLLSTVEPVKILTLKRRTMAIREHHFSHNTHHPRMLTLLSRKPGSACLASWQRSPPSCWYAGRATRPSARLDFSGLSRTTGANCLPALSLGMLYPDRPSIVELVSQFNPLDEASLSRPAKKLTCDLLWAKCQMINKRCKK